MIIGIELGVVPVLIPLLLSILVSLIAIIRINRSEKNNRPKKETNRNIWWMLAAIALLFIALFIAYQIQTELILVTLSSVPIHILLAVFMLPEQKKLKKRTVQTSEPVLENKYYSYRNGGLVIIILSACTILATLFVLLLMRLFNTPWILGEYILLGAAILFVIGASFLSIYSQEKKRQRALSDANKSDDRSSHDGKNQDTKKNDTNTVLIVLAAIFTVIVLGAILT